jgi:chromosome segregation ATPase
MNDFVTRVEWNGMMTVLERIESKIDSHERYFSAINTTFGSFHQRFDAMDQRFDAMDQRFDAMDQRFDAMDQRFDAMDQRFDRLEETVRHQGVLHERLESKVDAVIEVLGTKASKTELREEVSRLESKIDAVHAKLDAKIDTVHAKLDAKIDTVIELVKKR